MPASGAAGTLQNSQGFGAVWGTNAAGNHLQDGGATAVPPRLSRAAAFTYDSARMKRLRQIGADMVQDSKVTT